MGAIEAEREPVLGVLDPLSRARAFQALQYERSVSALDFSRADRQVTGDRCPSVEL